MSSRQRMARKLRWGMMCVSSLCVLSAARATAAELEPIGTLTVQQEGVAVPVPDRGYVFKVGNTARLFQLRGNNLVVFQSQADGSLDGLYAVQWNTREAPAWVSNEKIVTFGKIAPTIEAQLDLTQGEKLPVLAIGPRGYHALVERFGSTAAIDIPMDTPGIRFAEGAPRPAGTSPVVAAPVAPPPKAHIVIEGSGTMLTMRTNTTEAAQTPVPVAVVDTVPPEAVAPALPAVPPAPHPERKQTAAAPADEAPDLSAAVPAVRWPSLLEDRRTIIVICMFLVLLFVLYQIQKQLSRRRGFIPAQPPTAAAPAGGAPLRLKSKMARSTIHPRTPGREPAEASRDIPEDQPQRLRFVSSKKNQTVILGQQNLVGTPPTTTVPVSAGDTAIIPSPSILPEHRPGGVLFIGKYQVEQLLGRGRMGVVYKAFQQDLNRTVALKLLAEGAHASPKQKERFIKEAQAIAKLRHPNIVTVYEVGDWEGQPYFTMDFVEGKSLDKMIVKQKLAPREAARLALDIAEAVEYAHSNSIIHRDLKPGNIILNSKGDPVITDFGLARKLDTQSIHAGDDILGTPAYMSPEQARGRSSETDARSDVYAIGAILYAMLTGDDPFSGNSLLDTLHKVIHDKPASPEKVNPGIDSTISNICLKAMSKDPRKRYQSAGEMASDLARYLHTDAARQRAEAAAPESRGGLLSRLFARRA